MEKLTHLLPEFLSVREEKDKQPVVTASHDACCHRERTAYGTQNPPGRSGKASGRK